MPGIGAVAGAGVSDGLGNGLPGAGVLIGMPGMGAIVGCAAKAGETVRARSTAARLIRVASKRTSCWTATYYLP